MWLLIASLLTTIVCAGAFALLYLQSDERAQVLAVTRPVAAGQALSSGDLRVVRVAYSVGVGVVPASQIDEVAGRTAAVPLAEGSLLSASQVGPAAWPPEGQVVVATPVKPSRLAHGVVPGSRVLVVPVAEEPSRAGSLQPAGPEPVSGTVVQVRDGIDSAGTTVVTLLLAHTDAVSVASIAADVSLVVVRG